MYVYTYIIYLYTYILVLCNIFFKMKLKLGNQSKCNENGKINLAEKNAKEFQIKG